MAKVLLEQQLSVKQRALHEPAAFQANYALLTVNGIQEDQARFAKLRELERKSSKQRVFGSIPQGVGESFRDRVKHTAEIINIIISREDIRAVTIYGRAGVGKTALACKIMRELEKDYENIQGLIYLSTVILGVSLEQIFSATARILGGDAEKEILLTWVDTLLSIRVKVQMLIQHYRGFKCIIFLDNLEDFLRACYALSSISSG